MFEKMTQAIRHNPVDYIFVGTIVFFLISMINIAFAWLGMICMVTPFALAMNTGKNLWCGKYCPRSSFFTKVFGKISLKRKLPKVLLSQKTKRNVITFFCVNLVMISFSTLMVVNNQMPPLEEIRFLMFFTMPFDLPQLVTFDLPPVFAHLGYRIFSIMFSSTIIGVILALVYMPRAWCTICPVQTLVTDIVKKPKNNCESCA